MISILKSIRKMLGLDETDDTYDVELIPYINSAISDLYQLGVGPEGYTISNDEDGWSDLIGEETKYESVKTFIYLKVRLIFDPPQYQSTIDAIDRNIKQLEWRINVNAELGGG